MWFSAGTNTVICGPVCGVDVNADLQYKIRTLDTVTSNCIVTVYAITNRYDNAKRRKFNRILAIGFDLFITSDKVRQKGNTIMS